MNWTNTLFFLVFTYIMLTLFVVGHAGRYVTDPFSWNARSSEFLEKKQLYPGITLFHWGILFSLSGHIGGLLIPQSLIDMIGIDGQTHTLIAHWAGLASGLALFAGVLLLFTRRLTNRRIRTTSRLSDFVTLFLIVFVAGAGLYNVVFSHFYILDTIAPWIRGLVTFSPHPELMTGVPIAYKIHIVSALALLGFSPFSRLIHIWSVPFLYPLRRLIVFRRRDMNCPGSLVD